MPVLIRYMPESTDPPRGRVVAYHPNPQKLTGAGKDSWEQGAFIVEVDSIIEPEQQVGKSAVRYINWETLEQWVEYNDRPLTADEVAQSEIPALTERLAQIENATGVGAGQGQRGISQRLDDIENRITALENGGS